MTALWVAALAFAGREAIPMEWTMDQALAAWKPMVRPVQHVGVPGYEFQTGVMWDGALVFGPEDFLSLKVMQADMATLGANPTHVSFLFGDEPHFIDRHGTGNPAIRRSLKGGRIPMPSVETRDGDLVWSEDVFAHLLGRKPQDGLEPKADDKLITQVRFRVKNAGYASRTAKLWIHFGDMSHVRLGYKASQAAEPAPALPIAYAAPFAKIERRVRAVLPEPAKGKLEQHREDPRRLVEWSVPLAAGEEAELRMALPYGLVDEDTARRIAAVDPERERAEVEEYWRGMETGGARLNTSDPFVDDYFAAVQGQMAQQVAFRHDPGLWMYKTSPNHYEGYWPCNAAKALPAFDYAGNPGITDRVLTGFLHSQTDDIGGLDRRGMGGGDKLRGEGYAKLHGFLGNFGEWTANPLLISHGLGMWALAEHYRVTRNDRWLRTGKPSPLQAMLDGFDWVAAQRKRTMHEFNGVKAENYGLLPPASAHDWLAGSTVFNDAYCIYGMTEVVRLLREIHDPRAEEMAAELADYRRCLHERYVEATAKARPLPLPDGTSIPYVPRMIEELDWAKPDWTYTGYSVVRCGAFGVFEPKDRLVDLALAYLDAGMPKGEGAYYDPRLAQSDIADVNWASISDPNAGRHYLWRNYVEYETMWPVAGHLFLARDDLPRFFEWFFNNMAVAIHRDWRVGVESLDGVPSCAPGEGERYQAIRSMFVHEFGGYDGSQQSLFLFQAIPRCWLRSGARLSMERMATVFGGKVDVSMEVAADGRSVKAGVSLKGLAVDPAGVFVRLRSGDGRPLTSAEVNGQPVPVLPGDVVRLPVTRNGKFRLVGHF